MSSHGNHNNITNPKNSKLNLSRLNQDYSQKCQNTIINYISNNPKSLYLLSKSNLTRLDNYSNYLAEISQRDDSVNCSVLIPIPYKTKRKLRSSNEKRELNQAMSSAIALRRIVFSNQLKEKKLLKAKFLNLQCFDSLDRSQMNASDILQEYNGKQIEFICLIQRRWRSYHRWYVSKVTIIQRRYRLFYVKCNTIPFVVDNRDMMSFMSFKSRNDASIGIQVTISDNVIAKSDNNDNQNKDEYEYNYKENRNSVCNNKEKVKKNKEETNKDNTTNEINILKEGKTQNKGYTENEIHTAIENEKAKIINKSAVTGNNLLYTKQYYKNILIIIQFVKLLQNKIIRMLYNKKRLCSMCNNTITYPQIPFNHSTNTNEIAYSCHYQCQTLKHPILQSSLTTKIRFQLELNINSLYNPRAKNAMQIEKENRILLKMLIVILIKKIQFQVRLFVFKYIKHYTENNIFQHQTRNRIAVNTNVSLSSLYKGNFNQSRGSDSESYEISSNIKRTTGENKTNTQTSKDKKDKKYLITNDNSPINTIKSYLNDDQSVNQSKEHVSYAKPPIYNKQIKRGSNFEHTHALKRHKGDRNNYNSIKDNEYSNKITESEKDKQKDNSNNNNNDNEEIGVVRSKKQRTVNNDNILLHPRHQNLQLKLSKISKRDDSFCCSNENKDILEEIIIKSKLKSKPKKQIINSYREQSSDIKQSQTQTKLNEESILKTSKQDIASESTFNEFSNKASFYCLYQSLSKDKYDKNQNNNNNNHHYYRKKNKKEPMTILLRELEYYRTIN